MLRKIIIKSLRLTLRYIGSNGRSQLYGMLYSSYQHEQYNRYRKNYNISERFKFNGKDILFYGEGKILCGENSYIGNYSTIQSCKDCVVHIGSNCHISHNVRIYTTSNIADQSFNTPVKQTINGSVIIEDYVWIGANVFINPGISIGRNSVIGANSVVSKNIPPNTIWAGAPIKLLKEKVNKI
jgi:maltose O-acetyltransferase